MLDREVQAEFAGVVRTSQIIVAALAMGIVTFGAVTMVLAEHEEQAGGNVVTFCALAMAIASIPLSVLIPRSIVAGHRRRIAAGARKQADDTTSALKTDARQLGAAYQAKTIIGAALLEGTCFVALTAYLLEGQALTLVVAGILLLGVLAHFPTPGRAESWLDEQLRLVEEQRRLSEAHF